MNNLNFNEMRMLAISKRPPQNNSLKCKSIDKNTASEKIKKYVESGRLIFLDKQGNAHGDSAIIAKFQNNPKLIDKTTYNSISNHASFFSVEKSVINSFQQKIEIFKKIEWVVTDDELITLIENAGFKADEEFAENTLLFAAVSEGREKLVSYLLKSASSENIQTAIHAAFQPYCRYKKAIVESLIEKGAEIKNEYTPRIFNKMEIPFKTTEENLCRAGMDDEHLIYLIDKANLKADALNSSKETLLFAAVKNGREKLVSYLLKEADEATINNAFPAIFSPRCDKKNVEIVKYNKEILRAFIEKTKPAIVKEELFKQILVTPSWSGHRTHGISDAELIDCFEKGYIHIDAVNDAGMGILFASLTGGRPTLAFYLMEKGADVNALYEGSSPLHAAIQHARLMKVDKIAHVEAPHYESGYYSDNQGLTNYYRNLKSGSLFDLNADIMGIDTANKIVEKLIEKNANVNLKTKEGDTPLHLAIRDLPHDLFWKKDQALLEMLLKVAPDAIEELNVIGETPLSLACSRRFQQINHSYQHRSQMTDLLFWNLKDKVSIANHYAFSEAMYLLKKDHDYGDLIQFLLERGAKEPLAPTLVGDPITSKHLLQKASKFPEDLKPGLIDYLVKRGANLNDPELAGLK